MRENVRNIVIIVGLFLTVYFFNTVLDLVLSVSDQQLTESQRASISFVGFAVLVAVIYFLSKRRS
ncbi:hypothetical protein AC480_03955 [miscellaneous Crenarchaeota group archaeon SMTZ1-55]|nr:MAG: hypothetical protein AC480_03955 [miscellaneous Crenarchaeota group archaeon SMTZ1-55]